MRRFPGCASDQPGPGVLLFHMCAESISFTYNDFRYQFASEENRRTFKAKPERWRIQLNGECAAMLAEVASLVTPDTILSPNR